MSDSPIGPEHEIPEDPREHFKQELIKQVDRYIPTIESLVSEIKQSIPGASTIRVADMPEYELNEYGTGKVNPNRTIILYTDEGLVFGRGNNLHRLNNDKIGESMNLSVDHDLETGQVNSVRIDITKSTSPERGSGNDKMTVVTFDRNESGEFEIETWRDSYVDSHALIVFINGFQVLVERALGVLRDPNIELSPGADYKTNGLEISTSQDNK